MKEEGNINAPARTVILFANTSWYLWNFRRRMADAIKDHGVEVVFVAPQDDYSSRLAEIGRFVPINLSRSGKNPFAELLILIKIAGVFRRVKPALVLTWTPKPNIYASLVSRLSGIDVLPNVAGLGTLFVSEGALSKLVGAMYRAAFSRLTTVFFQNSEDRDDFVSAGWVEPAAAQVLPGSGVDTQRFSATPLPNNDPYVFMYAGRLLVEKGLPELVEAARCLREDGYSFVIRVYGHFDPGNPTAVTEQQMQSWCDEGLVDYRGASDRIEEAIQKADCVVLPSYYREGIPRILLEAAASGRPVITCDSIGCRDAVIADTTGLMCKPRNAKSLQGTMRRMLELSQSQRGDMARDARRFAKTQYDERIVIAAYLKAIGS